MKQEIKEAGDNIEKDLEFPLIRLNEFVNYLKLSRNFFNLIFFRSFYSVRNLLQGHSGRSFFTRYLRRKEIQDDLERCNDMLSNALELLLVRWTANDGLFIPNLRFSAKNPDKNSSSNEKSNTRPA